VKEPSEAAGDTLTPDFIIFGTVQRGVVVFVAELPPEPPVGADEPNQ